MRIKEFIKRRWAYLISLIFFFVIPVILLNEVIAVAEINVAFKITFVGFIVLFIIAMFFRKKLYEKILKLDNGVKRGVFRVLHHAVLYALILGLFWGISAFADKLFNLCVYCGISMAFGAVFLILDEYLNRPRMNEEGDNENG